MSKLNLTLSGFSGVDGLVTVNGKFVKFKKEKMNKHSASVEVKGDRAEVVLYRSHHYAGKGWFFWNFIYFIISVFGIFDIRKDKKCLVMDARFSVDASSDASLTLTRNKIIGQGKVVDVETSANYEELSNVQFYDADAIKRRLKMKIFKIIFIVLSILVTAFIVAVFV